MTQGFTLATAVSLALLLSLSSCGALRTPTDETPDEMMVPSAPVTEAPLPDAELAEGTLLTLPEDGLDGSPLDELEPREGLAVTIDVADLDGGEVHVELDDEDRPALRFPAFVPSETPPRAVVRVVPVPHADDDPLAPGTQDFAFGARFALDARSQGTDVDGGNNLVQRGLASDASQYKLEVDDLRPLCRIQGPEGVVEVRVTKAVVPRVWYRASCARRGAVVELSVDVLRGGRFEPMETVTAEAATGDLRWERPETPLSVGGKLAANGAVIKSSTDQFNGLVADVVLQIDN